VTAALLARGGFRGPSDILGGKYGYCNVYSDHPAIELTTQELGVRHEILNVGIKPYACCTTMHSIVDAVTQVRKTHRFGSEEIKEIRVGGSQKLVAYSGIYEINCAMAAQYSAPFCVALSLLGDIRNPKHFKKVSPDMKEFQEVMLKTKLYKDDALEALSPATEGAKVSVVLKDGRSLDAEVMHAKGNPKNPISFKETCEKFAAVTRDRLDVKKREHIIRMIEELESLPDITKLAKLLA
jgi:2-methylcitrate dehydratase PrpD